MWWLSVVAVAGLAKLSEQRCLLHNAEWAMVIAISVHRCVNAPSPKVLILDYHSSPFPSRVRGMQL